MTISQIEEAIGNIEGHWPVAIIWDWGAFQSGGGGNVSGNCGNLVVEWGIVPIWALSEIIQVTLNFSCELFPVSKFLSLIHI